MQLADEALIFDMLDEELLRSHINSVDPDLIVPEIEAINTQVLLDIEADRIVVPSGRAVDLTMNRDRIRDRATEIGLNTAKYGYADNLNDMLNIYDAMEFKVVVKPVMSSSGKGQSTVPAGNPSAAKRPGNMQ